MTSEETPRQRFLRNAQENGRTIRARQRFFEQQGDADTAATIGAIADRWDVITAEAQRQEDAGEP